MTPDEELTLDLEPFEKPIAVLRPKNRDALLERLRERFRAGVNTPHGSTSVHGRDGRDTLHREAEGRG